MQSPQPLLASSSATLPAPLPAPLDATTFDELPGGDRPRPTNSQLNGLVQTPSSSGGDAAQRAVFAASLAIIRAARADLASKDAGVVKMAQTRLLMTAFHLSGYVHGLGARIDSTPAGFGVWQSKIGSLAVSDRLDELEAELSAAILRPGTRGWREGLRTVGDALIGVGTTLLAAGLAQPAV